MAITISGSGITSANIVDGTIVNADINSSAAIAGSKLTGVGKVLQVVHNATATRTTFTSVGSWIDTSNSASITPASSTSKILVTVCQPTRLTGNTPIRGGIRILRDTAVVWNDAGFSEHLQVRNAADEFDGVIYAVELDSPGTTSSVTYKVQAKMTTGTGMYLWEGSYGTRIILMEIE